MSLIVTLVALALPGGAAEVPVAPLPRGCQHVHRKSAHRGVRVHLRHYRPRVKHKRVQHFIRCSKAPKRHRRYARRLIAWRHSYGPKWRIAFNRLAPWQQGWARSTAWCESRMNPYAVGGGGLYYSYFQWLPSTWYAAGGDRPVTSASFYHQAVLATRLPTSHWPAVAERRRTTATLAAPAAT